MRAIKPRKFDKEVSMLNIFITFILLVAAITGYILTNKYLTVNPNETEKNITDKTGTTISEEDALKLAKEKYYIAVSTLTTTSVTNDKLYNMIKTKDIVLTDQSLIDKLNGFGAKTYAINAAATIVTNYDDAISANFTKDFINNHIMYPNGSIANIDSDYYMIKDKIDNYFFKEAKLSLISKAENEWHFKVTNTNYDTSCAVAGEAVPSFTCTKTKTADSTDLRLIKEDEKWKISAITLISA